MATVCFLRSLQRSAVARTFGPGALQRQTGAIVPRKSLQVSAVLQDRTYGPAGDPTGNMSKTNHWRMERVMSIALIPIIPAAIISPNIVLDTALTTALVLHTHWGLAGVCKDYVHGQLLPKIVNPAVMLLSVMAFGGLCYLNYFDCGLGNAIRAVYTAL